MKKLIFVFCVLAFANCDKILFKEGVPPRGFETKEFSLSNFDRVELNNAFFVTIKKANVSKISAKGSGDDLDDLEVVVTNGKLDIRYDDRIRIKKPQRYKMEIEISTPNLIELEGKSASDTEISGFEMFTNFTAKISGASVLRLKKSVKNLTASVGGASKLILPLSVTKIDAEITGASSLDAFDSNSLEAYLELSGASRAELSVSKTLTIKASGASKVSYKGNPEIKQDLSGASKVVRE